MVNIYKLEENEFVFGGCVNDGIKMPYKDGFSRDLRVWHSGNQAISALLTSKGNYFYSKEPFKFEIKDGSLIIESDFEIKASRGDEKTLKGAYIGLKNDFFTQDHKHPNLDMFRYPQYNTWIEFGRDVNQEKVKKYAEEIINKGYPGAKAKFLDPNPESWVASRWVSRRLVRRSMRYRGGPQISTALEPGWCWSDLAERDLIGRNQHCGRMTGSRCRLSFFCLHTKRSGRGTGLADISRGRSLK